MKFSKIALAMGFGLVMASGMANADADTPAQGAAAGSQGHGTVHFKGEIIDAPCSISPDTADQTVDLGQVSNSALKDNGKSVPVPFNIKLQNCDVSTYKTVTATWGGTADVNMPTAWGITGSGQGSWPAEEEYEHPRWYITVTDAADMVYLVLWLNSLIFY